jgi:hypothetical protein
MSNRQVASSMRSLSRDNRTCQTRTIRLHLNPKTFLAIVGEGKTILEFRKDQVVLAQGDPATTARSSSLLYAVAGRLAQPE